MIYQKKVSFDKKTWYQLEWKDLDFSKFDNIVEDPKNIEELEEIINKNFPNIDFKYTFIGKWKK